MHPPQSGLARGIAWVAIPVALHLFLLTRYWYNAPILDDFDCILDSMRAMAGAGGLSEWARIVFDLQNEHRLALTRLIPAGLAAVTGTVDFRLLMLLGTVFMLAVWAFMRAEYAEVASGPVLAASAFLLLQWSYWEAFLMASAATAHLGVVFFAFTALFFALRPGPFALATCLLCGVLATYSQANGLLVLPIAAFGCLVQGRWKRTLAYALVGAALWVLYFQGYSRPPNHPSLFQALTDPVRTFQLFLIIIGGVGPNLAISQLVGAALLVVLGWATAMGLWRKHPTVYLWIAFVLASAMTVAVARVGFGLFYGSRYSVNVALLMALLVLGAASLTQPWRRHYDLAALGAAAVLAIAIAIIALPQMRERSFRGHLLAEVDPARVVGAYGGRYAGVYYPPPGQEKGARILAATVPFGWYAPRRLEPPLTPVTTRAEAPAGVPPLGVMDSVAADGATVKIRGWTGIAADTPGRSFRVYPAEGIRSVRLEGLEVREDVAFALGRQDMILAGFRIAVEYENERAAREAVPRLCILVEAPNHPITHVHRPGIACPGQ